MAAQRPAPRREIARRLAVRRRLQVRHLVEARVGQIQRKAVAESPYRVGVQLLELVIDVLALAGLAHAEALDCLGEDHGRLTGMPHCGGIGVVDLDRIMAPARQRPDLVVAHVGHHLEQRRIFAEEMLAHIGAVLRLVGLVFAVDALHHPLAQQPGMVPGQQPVPPAAPDHLDDVPARGAIERLEFLDHLRVAAHRAIEPLQIAVDDEDQIVELLAPRHRDRGQRLRLVHFPIAEEGPDLAALVLLQAPILQIAQEAALIGRHDGPEPHRHGGELPEVRHQARMRIRRQAAAPRFPAEIVELRFVDTALQIGARIDARRRMALDIDHVAGECIGAAAEEMIEADVVQHRRGGIGGDMPAHVRMLAGAQHHRHRVPADQRIQFALQYSVARIRQLALGGDRVDVRRIDAAVEVAMHRTIEVEQLVDQIVSAWPALDPHDGLQRFEPFARFERIDVLE